MALFLATLNQMGFLAFLMAVGFVLVKVRAVPGDCASLLSKLENNVFVPALVMGTFMTRFTRDSIENLGQYLLVGLIVAVIGMLLASLLGKYFSRERYIRNIYTYGLAFSNFGFMGNAVVQVLFPEIFINYLVFTLPFWCGIYLWGVPFLLMPSQEKKTGIRDWLKPFANPMLGGMVFGAVIGVCGIPLPDFITKGIGTLGDCMSPVAMLLTGMTIAGIDLKKIFRNVPVYIASVVRLVMIPLAAIGVLMIFRLEYSLSLCVVCNLVMPLGLSPVVIPAAYGKDTSDAAGMVLISSLMSCITIPVIFWVFSVLIH